MIVYKITNLVNGKIYVGQTMHTLAMRWSGHLCDSKRTNRNRTPLCNAIAKYGPKSFKVEALGHCDTIEELNKQEEQWILVLDATNKKVGYNVKFGGDNHHQKAEIRKPVVETGIVFDSLQKAAGILGVNETCVSMVLHGKRSHAGGLSFEFTEQE